MYQYSKLQILPTSMIVNINITNIQDNITNMIIVFDYMFELYRIISTINIEFTMLFPKHIDLPTLL